MATPGLRAALPLLWSSDCRIAHAVWPGMHLSGQNQVTLLWCVPRHVGSPARDRRDVEAWLPVLGARAPGCALDGVFAELPAWKRPEQRHVPATHDSADGGNKDDAAHR